MQLIKEIYNKLADDVSKKIFMQRLQYSITGDLSYIDELVDFEMLRHKENDIMYSLLEWINGKTDEVVLFGAGVAGDHIIRMLLRKGIKVSCFIDNNQELWEKNKYNIPIVSPREIEKNKYIVISSNKYVADIYKQLCDMGFSEDKIFLPSKSWWLGGEKQYFDSEILVPKTEEIFVDGGALDGEDTVSFFQWCHGSDTKAYVFEPAHCNQSRLRKLVETDGRIEYIDKGMWSEKGELRFSKEMVCSGRISNYGEEVVEVVSLDEVLNGSEVSFIKMDIEGSEMQALLGCKETIVKHKPRLAICVYHKIEDILEIPKLVLGFNPDYKLYLRHYGYVDTETVLYAV